MAGRPRKVAAPEAVAVGRVLAATVTFLDGALAVTLKAGESLPEKYAAVVTNPKAFVEAEVESAEVEIPEAAQVVVPAEPEAVEPEAAAAE